MEKAELKCENTKNLEIDLEKDCCGICQFYRLTVARLGIGDCHRRSPRRERSQSVWPGVLTVDWCGEFEKDVL